MSMIFLKSNYFNTNTMAIVDAANTLTVNYGFDRDVNTKWVTDGYGTTTSTVFSIVLNTATAISRIYLQNHNLKQFRIFYNSTTASVFSPAISLTTNSDTSSYFSFSTQTVSTVQIQIDLGMTTDTEKYIGEIYVGDTIFEFERNPNAASYKPMINKQKIVHRMPNGGVSMFVVEQKFKAEIAWQFITESFTSQLLNLYETSSSFVFVPFPTTTSWNGKGYEVAWTNDFDFKHSSNNQISGFGGKIIIEELA